MPRADFLTGLVILAVSAMLIGEGVTLPGAGGLIMKGGEPGRVPIFLGFVLAAMAIILVVRAISQNGHRLRLGGAVDAARNNATRRAVLVATGSTLYVALLGRSFLDISFDYTWLTFGFILAFIVIAEWELAPAIAERRMNALERRAPRLASRLTSAFDFLPRRRMPYVWLFVTATVQAALIAIIVAYVFEKEFYVQLP